MDHIYPSCVSCGKVNVTLGTSKGHRPMREACLETKDLVSKGNGKVDKDRAMKKGIMNMK